MTASFTESRPTRRGPSPVAAVAIGLIATVGVIVLLTVGVTFLGLAIAFPIAVPVAESYHLPVSAADAALAERFAAFWWAFLALAVGSFGAATVVIVKVGSFLSSPRD